MGTESTVYYAEGVRGMLLIRPDFMLHTGMFDNGGLCKVCWIFEHGICKTINNIIPVCKR